jgi:hypothetical protein
MAALSCIDLIINIQRYVELDSKLKNIGVGFIQIGAAKSHRHMLSKFFGKL